VKCQLGYSVFLGGEVAEQVSDEANIHYGYVQTILTL